MKKLDIIILCGGLGKRIRNKSKGMPKILIEIRKKIPFMTIHVPVQNHFWDGSEGRRNTPNANKSGENGGFLD